MKCDRCKEPVTESDLNKSSQYKHLLIKLGYNRLCSDCIDTMESIIEDGD